MSCAMVYWGQNFEIFERVFLKFGAVVDIRSLRDKRIGDRSPAHQERLFSSA